VTGDVFGRPFRISFSTGVFTRDKNAERRMIMIDVTRMNGTVFTINNDLIETIEEMPDTVITLTTGKKIIVKESRQEVKNLVKLYKREINCND
jgi:flagellar protein FlbD